MSESDAIKGIRKAARQHERAERTRREATADLLRFVREAQADGVSISRIAREAVFLGRAFTTCWRATFLTKSSNSSRVGRRSRCQRGYLRRLVLIALVSHVPQRT
jgi:hypothetical protein